MTLSENAARLGWLALPLVLLVGCGREEDQPGSPTAPEPEPRTVVLYTSQDTGYLQDFFAPFTQETGIEVKWLGDTEATKTWGLAQRILGERERPRADVFWNNEFANTVRLAQAGVLEPYDSPAASDIPEAFRDPQRRWTGFAARLRVFIVNTERLGDRDPPTSIDDYLGEQWRGETVLGRPTAGTTLTHVTALMVEQGEERGTAFMQRLKEHGVALAEGNAHVMRLVSRGEYTWGLTDTDDLHLALQAGEPVAGHFPRHKAGALVIPSTVALIKGAPHPEEARRLIDFILSEETERALSRGKSAQFPLRGHLPGPKAFGSLSSHYPLQYPPDYEAIGDRLEGTLEYIEEEFLK